MMSYDLRLSAVLQAGRFVPPIGFLDVSHFLHLLLMHPIERPIPSMILPLPPHHPLFSAALGTLIRSSCGVLFLMYSWMSLVCYWTTLCVGSVQLFTNCLPQPALALSQVCLVSALKVI